MTVNELGPVIKRASKSVAYQWPGVIEKDDVEQSIYLHLLERPSSVEKIREMDSKAKYRAIVGIGHQIAAAERNDYDHYKGSYRYSMLEIKEALSRGVLIEDLDGFNEVVVDLDIGLEHIATQYADAILKRYGEDGRVPDTKQDENEFSRGMTALVDSMNKSHRRRFSHRDDGVGTRKCITNSAAYVVSAQQYSGTFDERPL